MDIEKYTSLTECLPFLTRFRIITLPCHRLVPKDGDTVVLYLFGQELIVKYGYLRTALARLDSADACKYLHVGCDWETPLRRLVQLFRESPLNFQMYKYLPTLYQFNQRLDVPFPPSSLEFGGVGFPYHVKPSSIAGYGCFSTRTILPGEIIGEYWGKAAPPSIGMSAKSTIGHYTFARLCGDLIDATDVPCAMKYVNHSCGPNLFVDEVSTLLLFRAKTIIHEGEEMTIDYRHSADTQADLIPCNCGHSSCRGYTATIEDIQAVTAESRDTRPIKRRTSSRGSK
ncbi:SET domain-containing protein [Aduncisulcus paluster]|uniref:SET domain-containing protein n=1 Tax=Aduncisulcus paluster TaxID=2918883 RepID=A0ABQ5K208_9EUKA|nr:SET domain-containing protein [Aduncisulcus paluster]